MCEKLDEQKQFVLFTFRKLFSRVVDPDWFNTDPDPAFLLNTDPDPASLINPDPDLVPDPVPDPDPS
jgi:hypothetical protein